MLATCGAPIKNKREILKGTVKVILKQQTKDRDSLKLQVAQAHAPSNANKHLSGSAGRTILNTVSKLWLFHICKVQERDESLKGTHAYVHTCEWNEF